jgi:hypothetical protein
MILVILLYFIAWRWSLAKKKELEISSLRVCVCVFLTLWGLGIITIENIPGALGIFAPTTMVVFAYILRGQPPKPLPQPRYTPPAKVDPQPKVEQALTPDRLAKMERDIRDIKRSVGYVEDEVLYDDN